MEKDPLDELFVEEGEVNKMLVHEILVKYVRLTKEGGILPLEEFNYLTNDKRILIILLAKRVLALKGIASDFASPKEVQELSGLRRGTVNPTLRWLEDRGLLRNEGGKYKVPNYAITKLKSILVATERTERKAIVGDEKEQETYPRKTKLNKKANYAPVIKELIEEGFFDSNKKTIREIVQRLNEKGYNIHGRKIGAVAKALTLMCRDEEMQIERKEVLKTERQGNEKWAFQKK